MSALSNSEQDDSPSPPKRSRQETGDSESVSFTNWELKPVNEDPVDLAASNEEGLEDDFLSTEPMAELAAMLSMDPAPQPRRGETIADSSSSAVDAHFGAVWDGLTGRDTGNTSGHGHLLPAFEDDWYHDPLDREGV
jgi:hypothetical protein